MPRIVAMTAVLSASLVWTGTAEAIAPYLSNVTQGGRRPAATFSAPRASGVTIYFASKPDRATDGKFLSENIEDLDSMTDPEIQSGVWLYERKLDPGIYYVMIDADPDFSTCYRDGGVWDPACADGYSDVVALVVPKPVVRYTVGVVGGFLREARIRANSSGQAIRYRLCSSQFRKRHCVAGTIPSYGWDEPATDSIYFSGHDFEKRAKRAVLTWYVGSRRVGARTIRVGA